MTMVYIMIDRKANEEMLAAHYWGQPRAVQEQFLRSMTGRPPAVTATDGEIRQAISDALARASDATLGALAQALITDAASA
jgi:hypothetical protein